MEQFPAKTGDSIISNQIEIPQGEKIAITDHGWESRGLELVCPQCAVSSQDVLLRPRKKRGKDREGIEREYIIGYQPFSLCPQCKIEISGSEFFCFPFLLSAIE